MRSQKKKNKSVKKMRAVQKAVRMMKEVKNMAVRQRAMMTVRHIMMKHIIVQMRKKMLVKKRPLSLKTVRLIVVMKAVQKAWKQKTIKQMLMRHKSLNQRAKILGKI